MTDKLYSAYEKQLDSRGNVNSMLQNMINEQKAAARRQKQELEKQMKSAEAEQLRGEYIRKNQVQSNLPQQIATVGGGGVSESAVMGLENDYSSARTNIMNNTAAQLAKASVEIDKGLSANLSKYYQAMADYAAQLEERQAEQSRWQTEFDYKREQDNYEKEQDALKSKVSLKQYSSAADKTASESSKAVKQPAYKEPTEKEKTIERIYRREKGYLDNYYDPRMGYGYIGYEDPYKKVAEHLESSMKTGHLTVSEVADIIRRLKKR